jgi:DNA-binding transcriptional ArsR family regulator
VPEPPTALFEALADPTRRRLLDQLADEGPRSATELAVDYPISRQAVARHLGTLTEAGLVTPVRQGRDVRYRVRPEAVVDAGRWLARTGADWDRRLAALRDRLDQGATD